ncbi:MAG: hypothetical protein QOI98_128 [Solirubrobacteraceae bacterium]|nr:hypothetical protein [Solirubrobacteraceae bacterium]
MSVGIPTLVVAVAINLLLRTLAIHVADVPSDLDALNGPAFIMGTIMPVIGNTGGFFAAYRHPYRDGVEPARKHHLLFLLPGAAFFCAAMILALVSLPHGASTKEILTAVVVNIVPTALVLPALHFLGRP